jgi:phospholipid/cholesterol/gamma-HCH transport system substrate-binding protein
MIRLRHTDEWIGFLVVVAVLIFVGAMLEAGVLSTWFRPVGHLKIVLPQSGVGGLSAGADIQVLGIHSGTVRRIVLNPDQQMYAEADIDRQAEPFIRRDSTAVIRRTFGVAGAAFVDISRGKGTPLDWRYAVIEATTETAPTDTLTAMLARVQEKVFPVLDDAKRTMDSLAALTSGLQKGQGTVGRLMTNDTMARDAEHEVADLRPVIARLNDAAAQLDLLVKRTASGQKGVPELLDRVDKLLANVQSATRQLALAAPRLPAISSNIAGASSNLPPLLTQTEDTAAELQKLVTQLRGLWLLGGSGRVPPEQRRLPSTQLEP